MSIRTKGLAVLAIPLIGLIAVSASLAFAIHQQKSAEASVTHTMEVSNEIQGVLANLLNAETGVRGYLLTGQDSFLDPYRSALNDLPPALARLQSLVREEPSQRGLATKVVSLAENRLGTLDQLRQLTLPGSSQRTRNNLLVQGKETMDALRRSLAGMQSIENQLLAERQQAERIASNRTAQVLWAALLLGLAAGLPASLLFTRRMSRRAERLQRNAALLARGEPLLPMPPGHDEIGRLGQTLEEAGALLEQRAAALRESEARFRLLAENSLNIISRFRLGPEPGLEYISSAVRTVLGWDPQQYYDDPAFLFETIHPKDRQLVLDVLSDPDRSSEPLVLRNRTKDGQYRWIEQHMVLLRDESGAPLAIQGSAHDITERRIAEQALIESEALKSSILESIAEGTVITDPEGLIVAINPAMERLSGTRQADVRGKPFAEAFTMLGEDGRPKAWEETLLFRSIHERQVMTTRGYQHTLLAHDGRQVPFGGTASPMIDDHGNLLGGVEVVRDVSYEREVDLLKSNLVSTVSHELRTPLTMIRGFSELLMARELGPERSSEALSQISASSERLSRLIDDLLSVSRIESGQLAMRTRSVDVSEAIREAAAPLSGERSIELHLEDGMPSAEADPDMLAQILTNLVSNAMKYSPEGSPVEVRARSVGSSIEVSVRDYGIGMDEVEMAHLFQRFYRSDREEVRHVGGTGLGLYITRTLVERQRGRIEAHSTLGEGSTFVFTLPMATAGNGSKVLASEVSAVPARTDEAAVGEGAGPRQEGHSGPE